MKRSIMVAGLKVLTVFRSLAVGLLLLTASRAAAADGAEEARLAVPVAARSMVIGRFNLLLGAEPGVLMGGTPGAFLGVLPLRFGITDDLEVFASPVVQSVDPILHEPDMGVLYRVIRGPVEVGARLASDLSLFGQVRSARLLLGVPVRIHVGPMLTVDLGVNTSLALIPQSEVGLLVPLGAAFNITESVFVRVDGAARIQNVSAAGSSFGIPLSAMLGYTVASSNRPFLDLAARAIWDDVRSAGTFSVVASGRLYLYL